MESSRGGAQRGGAGHAMRAFVKFQHENSGIAEGGSKGALKMLVGGEGRGEGGRVATFQEASGDGEEGSRAGTRGLGRLQQQQQL